MPKTVEELEAELSTVREELAGAKARITELNGESGGHRSAYTREKKAREELEAKLSEQAEEHAEALKKAAAAAEREKIDLTGRATAAETAAAEARNKAAERARNADLRLAANEAGLRDMDGLKLLAPDALQLNEDGDVTNASEALAKLKADKPYLFGTGSTSSTHQAPPANDGKPKRYQDMNPDERKAAGRAAGITVL